MSNLIENLKKGQNLSFSESKLLFTDLMEGKYEENYIIEILEAFIKKGETKDELAGGIFVLRNKANKVKADEKTIDTCGTGGDGQNSLNISTAAAIAVVDEQSPASSASAPPMRLKDFVRRLASVLLVKLPVSSTSAGNRSSTFFS